MQRNNERTLPDTRHLTPNLYRLSSGPTVTMAHRESG